jgi:hypothetical protein
MSMTAKCPQCFKRFWPHTRGRKKTYCSNACRQAAYRERKARRAYHAWKEEMRQREPARGYESPAVHS